MAKYQLLKTFPGTAVYAWLDKPDTKFDAAGRFSLVLRGEDEDPRFKKFIEGCKAAAVANIEAKLSGKEMKAFLAGGALRPEVHLPWGPAKDSTEGGKVLVPGHTDVKMGMKHTIKTDDGVKYLTPTILDSAKNDISGKVRIGRGSILTAVVKPLPWGPSKDGVGVSLQLQAVQVLKLVTFASLADMFDDEDEEGEFVYGEATAPEETEGGSGSVLDV